MGPGVTDSSPEEKIRNLQNRLKALELLLQTNPSPEIGRLEDRMSLLEDEVRINFTEAKNHAENLFAALIKIALPPPSGDMDIGTAFNEQETFCLTRLGFKKVDFHRMMKNTKSGCSVAVTKFSEEGYIDRGYTLTQNEWHEDDPFYHHDSEYPIFWDLLIDLTAVLDLAG
ncbi:MAG: hypothetical protein WC824_12725 [Bacteroidota bacterium]|jgi:hypothetical protein